MAHYALLKSQGRLIDNHPTVKKLIYLKYLIEKTKSIDTKLKPQIDKLIKLAESANEEVEQDNRLEIGGDSKVYRPQLLDDEDEGNEEQPEYEDEEDENQKTLNSKKKSIKYKVENNFTDFYETKNEDKLRKSKIDKLKKKIRESEMYKNLKNETSEAPIEFKNNNSHVVCY